MKSLAKIMRITVGFSLFFVFTAVAKASNLETLKVCQTKVTERVNELTSQPMKVARLNTLENCVQSLLDLNNPKILAQEGIHIEGFQCGFWCREQTSFQLMYMNLFSGKQDYINLILSSINEEERVNFESSYFGGVEALVSSSYDEYYEALALKQSQRKPGRAKPGSQEEKFAVLKKIITDFTQAYFASELRAMNVKDTSQFKIDVKAKEYSENLRTCLSKAQSSSQIEYCVDQLKIFGAADSGRYILQQNLQQHLLPETNAKYHTQITKISLDEYNKCVVNFFFSDEESDKPVQKIKSCVYSSMIDAFKNVVRIVVVEELIKYPDLDSNKVDSLLARGMNSCQRADIINPQARNAEYYKILMNESPESAKKILMDCRADLEAVMVKDIALVAIENHPQIKEFLGSNAPPVAQSIMNKYYNVCLDKIKASGSSPQACESYLMAATIFEVFENHIDNKVISMIQSATGTDINTNLVKQYLQQSKEQIQECRASTMDNLLNQLGRSKEQTEALVVSCLKNGFYVFVEQLARDMFKAQIEENSVLKKYNVEIGENKMRETLSRFNECFQSVSQSSNSISTLIDGAETGLETCQLEATKEIVLFALDLILVQELQRTGITADQVKGVLDTYKSREDNLFKSIENARSSDELDTLTATGDFEVIKSIAYNVIYLIIRKDVKDYMSQDKTKEFARKASASMIACAETKSLGDCQTQITPDIMADIIRYLVPIEVEKEFVAATKSLLSQRQAANLGVAALVKWWLEPGQTNTGTALVRYMVEKVAKGESIAKVQASYEVRNRVFIILTESKNFFGRFLKAIIQPELDKAKNEPNGIAKFFRDLFVSQDVYVWDNIVTTSSGQQAVVEVKNILNRVIVQGKQFSNQDKDRIVNLVTEAAKEYNRRR